MKRVTLFALCTFIIFSTGCAKYTETEMKDVKEDYEIQIEELTEKYEEEISDLEDEVDSLEDDLGELETSVENYETYLNEMSEYEVQVSNLTAQKDFLLELIPHVLEDSWSSDYAILASYVYDDETYDVFELDETFGIMADACPEDVDFDLFVIGVGTWSSCMWLYTDDVTAEEVYENLSMIMPVWDSVGTDNLSETEQEMIEILNLIYDEVTIIYTENIVYSETDEHYIKLGDYIMDLDEVLLGL